jgi:hypothetical protein
VQKVAKAKILRITQKRSIGKWVNVTDLFVMIWKGGQEEMHFFQNCYFSG